MGCCHTASHAKGEWRGRWEEGGEGGGRGRRKGRREGEGGYGITCSTFSPTHPPFALSTFSIYGSTICVGVRVLV